MADQENRGEQVSIPYFGLTMVRPKILDIPEAALPGGFSIRTYRTGDEEHWARIEQAAGEFKSTEAALRRFREEFGEYTDEMERRCLFVADEREEPIGTTTAWYGELDGRVTGRIHWVAIVPEYQGRKLAKSLLSAALRTRAQFHDNAYLTTQDYKL